MRSKWLEWRPGVGFVGFAGSLSTGFPITRGSEESETRVSVASPNELMEKTSDGEPTEPTKPRLQGFERTDPRHLAITHSSEYVSSQDNDSHDAGLLEAWHTAFPTDPYAQRLRTAMRELVHREYAAGMIIWLRQACPALYLELTEGLPNKMQSIWEAQAPVEEFQNVVNIWLKAHRTSCEIYEKYLGSRPRAAAC
jgi:hypothetical protein